MANSPKQGPVGAVSPEFQQSFDRLKAAAAAAQATIGDANTTIKALRGQVKTNMTPAEVAAFQGQMDQLSSDLEGAKIDPENPPAP